MIGILFVYYPIDTEKTYLQRGKDHESIKFK
jgi:hypothetical protein